MVISVYRSSTVGMLFRSLTALALISGSVLSYQLPSPFWATKIDSALHIRDTNFRALLQDTLQFSIAELDKIHQEEICARLLNAPEPANPWQNFILGILECNKEKSDSSGYFAEAMTLAQQEPGVTWALFVEFTRNQKTVWAERCLLRLEKMLFASGAQSAPVIAQQLLYYAYLSEKQKNFTSAFSYYRWAERFDHNQPWSLVHRLVKCVPSHPQLFVSTLKELVKTFSDSWILQLHAASHVYTWLHYFVLIFVLIVFAGIGLRYLPAVVHLVADRLPEDTPAVLKTVLPVCLALSFISFGIIPFLLLFFFFTWRFSDKKEKTVFLSAFLLLVCSPVDARILDMFRQALMPQGSLTIFIRASEEGYSPALHQRALEKVVIDRSDALAFMAASLCAIKKGDTAAAELNAGNALLLRPDNPLCQILAGNAAYYANDYKKAASYYQKVLSRYPSRMEARFNLAQCYARRSDTSIDFDFLKLLSSSDQTFITNFTNINNLYFMNNWPPLRQLIPLSINVSDFWNDLFPSNNGSWSTANNVWSTSFLGLSPMLSFIVFIALAVAFIAWNVFLIITKRTHRAMSCRLCKRIICDRCKKNDLCVSCSRATRHIRNVKMLAAVQSSIINRRNVFSRFSEYVLDICAPGCGMMFSNRHSSFFTCFVILITSIIYSSFLFLSTIHSGYPLWVVYDKIGSLPYFLSLYNAIFVCRALLGVFKKGEPVLE